MINKPLPQFIETNVDGGINLYLYKGTLYISVYYTDQTMKQSDYVVLDAKESGELTKLLQAMIRRQDHTKIGVHKSGVSMHETAGVSKFDFRTEVKAVTINILNEDKDFVIIGPASNIYGIGHQRTRIDDEKLGEKVMYAFKFCYAMASA